MSYQTILTNAGAAKIAAAIAGDTTVDLTTMVLGDGGGSPTTPVATQTALVNQVWSGDLNEVIQDPSNTNWIDATATVPSSVGGWTIREVGLLDNTGTLIAVGNFPDTYKPVVTEGAVRNLLIEIIVAVGNASAVTLTIDPSIVMASEAWVADNFLEITNKLSELYALGGAAMRQALANLGITKDTTLLHGTTSGLTIYDNGAATQWAMGQDSTHAFSAMWNYNATAADASAVLACFEKNNDLTIQALDIYLESGSLPFAVQVLSSGRVRVGGGTDDTTSAFQINGDLGINPTTATSATGGSATALPAAPLGYWVINNAGTSIKVPFYAA